MNWTSASRWGVALALVVAMLFFPVSVSAGPKWYRLNQDVAVGGGASAFTDLTDTPGTITANQPVYGNPGGDALIFGTDDDVPESGDFGAAADLEADGSLSTGVVGDNEIDYSEVTLLDFDYQTAWRLFYSDGSGDVQELAFGALGTVLTSQGAAAAPIFDTGAAGDLTDVWGCSTGDCQTLTADGSDSLDATSASYIIPFVVTTDCSAVTGEGRACWDSDDDDMYVGDGAAAKSWAASGDVTGVGDCASGACFDGSSDGGTTFDLYDGDSHKATFAIADLSGDVTYTFPASTGTVVLSTTDDDVPEAGDFGAAGALDADGDIDVAYIQDWMIDWSDVTLLDFDYQNPWMIFYSNGSGDVVEMAFGTAGYVFTSNGATAAPSWTLTSTGDVTMVGECTTGDCFDGSTDGGNYLRFTDDGSYYTTLQAATGLADNITITMPSASGTLITSGSDDDIPESGEGDFADAVDLDADGSLSDDAVDADAVADDDFGDFSCSSGVCTLDADVIAAAEMADADFGDWSCSGGSCTLDADVVSTAEIADADFGDWSCSGGSCTLDADVVDADAIADDDFGDFTCSGGNCTLDDDFAPEAEPYVTRSASANLSNEYAMQNGTGISLTNGGAPPNSTVTISCDNAAAGTKGCSQYSDSDFSVSTGDVSLSLGSSADGYVLYNNSGDINGESTLFWDDSSDYLGIGTATPGARLHIKGTSSFDGWAVMERYSNDATPAYWVTRKGRAGAIVNDDDYMGLFGAYGWDGDSWAQGAAISIEVDGTPGDGDMPSRIDFYTTADGSEAWTERMSLTSDGRLVPSNSTYLDAWSFNIDGTPASDDTYSGITIDEVNCGESISQWDLVYMDDTSNEWMQADANAAGEFPAVGMAVAACTDGNPGTILIQGVVRNAGWSATITGEGKAIYLSETAGGITETQPSDAGDCVQHIGRVLSDTNDTIYVNPSLLWVEIGS